MIEARDGDSGLLMVGAIVIASIMARACFPRIKLPPMVGYILIGIGLVLIDAKTGFLTETAKQHIDFLAELGVVFLLFRAGLESDLSQLKKQLKSASLIWLPNMIVAGGLVFLVVYFWPDYGFVPALFAGVAASATSIGVSTAVWEEAGALKTPQGALLLDVAELDDISAVVLLSFLFAITPLLTEPNGAGAWPQAALTVGVQVIKLAAFAMGCLLFSQFLEKRLTGWFAELDEALGPVLFATGAALLIAAGANLFGFSLAVGALLAGLAFSRDPAEPQIEQAFGQLFALFSPFFFIAIGLALDPAFLGQSLTFVLILCIAAILGKVVGAGLPAALMKSPREGWLIGFSMTPRAEIFLIVMLYGVSIGAAAVPQSLYNAAVLVSLASCIFGPIAVNSLLSKNASRVEAA